MNIDICIDFESIIKLTGDSVQAKSDSKYSIGSVLRHAIFVFGSSTMRKSGVHFERLGLLISSNVV